MFRDVTDDNPANRSWGLDCPACTDGSNMDVGHVLMDEWQKAYVAQPEEP